MSEHDDRQDHDAKADELERELDEHAGALGEARRRDRGRRRGLGAPQGRRERPRRHRRAGDDEGDEDGPPRTSSTSAATSTPTWSRRMRRSPRTTTRRRPTPTRERGVRYAPEAVRAAGDAERRDGDAVGLGGDRADPPRARVVAGEQLDRGGLVGLRHDDGEAAAHVEDLPHLGLGDVAELAHEPEHGRHGQRVGDLEADVGVQAQQVQQPAAGDVRQAAHVGARAQQLEHRAHVDHRRLEQRVGHRGAAERGRGARRARGRRRRAARGGRARSRWSAGPTTAGRSARRRARRPRR